MKISSFNVQHLPAEASIVYRDAHAAIVAAGFSPEEANRYAIRTVQHMGYFQNRAGIWEKIGPNLLGKVNLRCAEPQPDGRFMVRDVIVFLPNAVKGTDEDSIYTADKIREMIGNTNRNIVDEGGQPPSLVKEHPNPFAKSAGTPSHSFGRCMNWREAVDRPGYAVCDFFDVDPGLVEEWKAGRWTGLSAGVVEDNGGTNKRFGHVAMLGGDSQALASLPTTELVFSANQLFFSAQPAKFFGSKVMPGQIAVSGKKISPQFRAAQLAFHAALASFEAGEPGADAKLKAAAGKFSGEYKNFCDMQGYSEAPPQPEENLTHPQSGATAVQHPDEQQDEELVHQMLGEHEAYTASQEPQEETHLPNEPELGGEQEELLPQQVDLKEHKTPNNGGFAAAKSGVRPRGGAQQFAANPQRAVAAVQAVQGIQRQTQMAALPQGMVAVDKAKFDSALATIGQLHKQLNTMHAQKRIDTFRARLTTLKNEGREGLNVDMLMKQFAAVHSNPEAVQNLLDFAASFPKTANPLTQTMFDVGTSGYLPQQRTDAARAEEDAEVQRLIQKHGRGASNFSASADANKALDDAFAALAHDNNSFGF